MPPLEQIRQMRMRGMDDSAIINQLQQQGVSPRQINDAMAQSKVKAAVADEQIMPAISSFGARAAASAHPDFFQPQQQFQMPEEMQSTQELEGGGMEMMQPSVMGGEINAPMPGQENYQYEEQQPSEYQEYEEQPAYGQESYSNEYRAYGEPTYSAASTEVIEEIAEQIIQEKFDKTNKTIESLKEVKILLVAQVEKLDERLKRIEAIIDQLQSSLMRRSSEQIEDLTDIKSEMRAMQTGFSKIINPLVEEAREAEVKLEKTIHRRAPRTRKTPAVHVKKSIQKKTITKRKSAHKKKSDLDDFLKF